MELQRFVTEVIEALGGIVIPLEYALCHVILPDENKELFDGRSEFILAFDFEVYQENENSEFVTFGSYILDKILYIASKKAVFTIRFGIIDRLSLSDPLDKIKEYLDLPARTNVKIMSERPVLYPWITYNFRITYVSDERMEEMMEVWADAFTGNISKDMNEQRPSIFYELNPIYNYPIVDFPNISKAFNEAYMYTQKNAQTRVQENTRKDELNIDLYRINNYYRDLENEILKRMKRKGITEEHRQELESKRKALLLEKEKQLAEMQEKYEIKLHISLDNAVIYAIPNIEYVIDTAFRDEKLEKRVYYNPVLRNFS